MPYATRSRTRTVGGETTESSRARARDEAPQSSHPHVIEPQVPTSSKAGASKSKDKPKKKAAQPAEVVTVKTAKTPAVTTTAKGTAKDPTLSALRMPPPPEVITKVTRTTRSTRTRKVTAASSVSSLDDEQEVATNQNTAQSKPRTRKRNTSSSVTSVVEAEENSQPKLRSRNTRHDDCKTAKTTKKPSRKEKVVVISDSDDEDLMQPVVNVKTNKTTVAKKVEKKRIIKPKLEKIDVKDVRINSEVENHAKPPAPEGRQLRSRKPKVKKDSIQEAVHPQIFASQCRMTARTIANALRPLTELHKKFYVPEEEDEFLQQINARVDRARAKVRSRKQNETQKVDENKKSDSGNGSSNAESRKSSETKPAMKRSRSRSIELDDIFEDSPVVPAVMRVPTTFDFQASSEKTFSVLQASKKLILDAKIASGPPPTVVKNIIPPPSPIFEETDEEKKEKPLPIVEEMEEEEVKTVDEMEEEKVKPVVEELKKKSSPMLSAADATFVKKSLPKGDNKRFQDPAEGDDASTSSIAANTPSPAVSSIINSETFVASPELELSVFECSGQNLPSGSGNDKSEDPLKKTLEQPKPVQKEVIQQKEALLQSPKAGTATTTTEKIAQIPFSDTTFTTKKVGTPNKSLSITKISAKSPINTVVPPKKKLFEQKGEKVVLNETMCVSQPKYIHNANDLPPPPSLIVEEHWPPAPGRNSVILEEDEIARASQEKDEKKTKSKNIKQREDNSSASTSSSCSSSSSFKSAVTDLSSGQPSSKATGTKTATGLSSNYKPNMVAKPKIDSKKNALEREEEAKRKKAEILQQKQELQKKKNEEWKKKADKIKLEEEKKKPVVTSAKPKLPEKPMTATKPPKPFPPGSQAKYVMEPLSLKPSGPMMFKSPAPAAALKATYFPPAGMKPSAPAPARPAYEDEAFRVLNNSLLDTTAESTFNSYDITRYEDLDDDLKHRENKHIPEWARDKSGMAVSLFKQVLYRDHPSIHFTFPKVAKGYRIYDASY